ncbi:conserved hypothetical protein [Rhodopseudomonas palustris TIE-1]|uniref:SA1788 family PVL leukocidin-associated protein n=1 Tax=Rhodopseudomonas palustris TaxID=1076 RepID=UPI000164B504|nr:SA1788 family PVL leukocidin-associated protein [Rhodopseudomonas palustris]ACF02479.1 conserved hypothetical protein [Rhodopseudomonas palustris TIE-1]
MGAYILLTYKGVTKSIAEWSKITGISDACIRKRLHEGWPVDRVLTQPKWKRVKGKSEQMPITLCSKQLEEWQRDIHRQHRELSRNIRAFVTSVENQMSDLRYNFDRLVAASIAGEQRPGVGPNSHQSRRDRSLPTAQEST